MAANPIRYSGDMKIGRWTSKTVFGGFDDPINFKELQITVDGDTIIQEDRGIDYFGQAKSVNYQPKPTKIQATLDEFNTQLLADFLRGTLSTFSQSAATGETVTVTLIKDKWVDLGTMNIDHVTITGKVEGTDFEVDKTLGHIRALTVGGAGSHAVSFDRGAIAGNKILIGGNTGPIYYGLSGRVKDHNSGTTGVLQIPQISIDPKTALDIIGAKGNQEAKFDAFAIVIEGSPLFSFFPDLAMTAVA